VNQLSSVFTSALVVSIVFACEGSETTTNTTSGGTTANGGATAISSSNGGVTVTSSAPTEIGGSTATATQGTIVSAGGNPTAGGSTSTLQGTTSSTGGVVLSSTGGAASTGGTTVGSTGGRSSTGGSSLISKGGSTQGGASNVGGANTGGTKTSTGGSPATGGTTAISCATPFKFKTPFMDGKIYTADPSAHVFNGKVYIYPSHDLATNPAENADADHFNMADFHVYSTDLACWPVTDHGEILNIKDVPWASKQMWAPDAAFKNNKYYFYFPARDKSNNFRIGVATSLSPTGPFKAEAQPIAGSSTIDPAVFVDDDGATYMYFGGKQAGQLPDSATGPRMAKMSEDMLSFSGSVTDLKINGANTSNSNFFEGSWVHKYKGTYYLSYSTGPTHLLAWATSTSPLGPFTYKGTLLSAVSSGWTTHHSIIEFNGKWYLFYADSTCSGGVTQRRCVKVQEFTYKSDGSLPTLSP
jgi:hypothetical protein